MGVSPPGQNTDDLKSQLHTLTKQFLEYDADGRVTRIVTAPTHSSDQDPATEVRYEYVTPVGTPGNQVEKMVERAVDSNGVKIKWLAAYELVGPLP